MSVLNRLKNFRFILLLAAMVFLAWKIYYMKYFPIKDFSEPVISLAASRDVNISSVIFWYFIYAVPLCLIFGREFLKTDLYAKISQKLKNFSIPFNEFQTFLGILILSNIILRDTLNTTSLGICLVLAAMYLYKSRDGKVDGEDILFIWTVLFFSFYNLTAYVGLHKNFEWCLGAFFVVTLIFCTWGIREEKDLEKAYTFTYFFALAGSLSSILLFVGEISLVRGHRFNDLWLIVPYAIALLAMIFFILRKKILAVSHKKLIYLSLFMVVAAAIPALGQQWTLNFYEWSNAALTIQELIMGVGLPIFDNLDAHLFSGTLGGIIYYFLTGGADYTGTILSPNALLINWGLFTVSFYAFLRIFFEDRRAFIITVLFPIGFDFGLIEGLFTIPIFIWWCKKNNLFADIILTLSFIALSLYRIDLGASFGVALILCPILFNLLKKNFRALIRYIVVFATIAALGFLTAYGICIYRDINFLESIEKFLTAFSSNQHWGIGNLGSGFKVILFYFLLPIINSVLIIPYFPKLKTSVLTSQDWVVIFLYLVFIFNTQRALVRHTLAEYGSTAFVLPMFLAAILIINLMKTHRAFLFMLTYLALSMTITNNAGKAAFDSAANKMSVIFSVHNRETTIFKFTDEDAQLIGAVKNFFDENLSDNQTYFDFSDQSLMFAYTGRINPVYVNQTPAMINGKRGQLQALRDLQKKDVPFVLMPYRYVLYCSYSIDGTLNVDRYYLLFEHIAENYRPYFAVGRFAIWCKKSDYNSLIEKDLREGRQRDYLNYDYELPDARIHYLGAIPFLWGNYASDEDKRGEYFPLENLQPIKFIGQRGFFVITISSEKDSDATLKLNYGGKEIFYNFNLREGEHTYRIRASTDILWYSQEVPTPEIIAGDATVKSVEFQKVDSPKL